MYYLFVCVKKTITRTKVISKGVVEITVTILRLRKKLGVVERAARETYK